MKKLCKHFGILVVVAVIGFSMSGCPTDTTGNNTGQVPSVGTPTGVTAIALTSNTIAVTWERVHWSWDWEAGYTGYRVYKSSSSSGTFSFLGYAYMTEYNISGLSSNTTYYFKVSAFSSRGESSLSLYAYATTRPSLLTLGVPTVGSRVSRSVHNHVDVYWWLEGDIEILGYHIYHSLAPSGPFVFYTTIWNYSLTTHQSGYFKVSAFNDSGEGPKSSAVASATPRTFNPLLGTPSVTAVRSGNNTFVNWTLGGGSFPPGTTFMVIRTFGSTTTTIITTSTSHTETTGTGMGQPRFFIIRVINNYHYGPHGNIVIR